MKDSNVLTAIQAGIKQCIKVNPSAQLADFDAEILQVMGEASLALQMGQDFFNKESPDEQAKAVAFIDQVIKAKDKLDPVMIMGKWLSLERNAYGLFVSTRIRKEYVVLLGKQSTAQPKGVIDVRLGDSLTFFFNEKDKFASCTYIASEKEDVFIDEWKLSIRDALKSAIGLAASGQWQLEE
jgi:hypothetical protein